MCYYWKFHTFTNTPHTHTPTPHTHPHTHTHIVNSQAHTPGGQDQTISLVFPYLFCSSPCFSLFLQFLPHFGLSGGQPSTHCPPRKALATPLLVNNNNNDNGVLALTSAINDAHGTFYISYNLFYPTHYSLYST